MKAGKTNIEVGTRVKITKISGNDPDDKALIGMIGEITHPFGGLMSPGVNYIAGVRLDDGSITNLTSGDKVKVVRGKGKGWHGDTPGHRKAALKAEGKGAINEPIKTGRAQAKHTYLQGYIINGMKFTLVGVEYTETKANKKAIQYAKDNTVAEVKKVGDEYLIYVSEQYAPTKAHRKLTEKERDRMINMHASAPLTYIPAIDDELMKLGLAQFWDNMPDAVENTDIPFYADNGGILPEWYDFKAETARYEAERVSKYTPPYRVDVWEERDRLIITVYDSKDNEVASWVDDEAREMFEDGFFDSKDVEESVLGYLTDIGTIRR